ncbi:MAG: hypothetical protein K0S30_1776 [Clostridia bacterium]|nr:hypothetical protein [Clostridia bacterium]
MTPCRRVIERSTEGVTLSGTFNKCDCVADSTLERPELWAPKGQKHMPIRQFIIKSICLISQAKGQSFIRLFYSAQI